MVNTDLLYQKIKESGLQMGILCQRAGISYGSLKSKLDKGIGFKTKDVEGLQTALGLTNKERDEIFFASVVAPNSNKNHG